jgi:anthranilate synthase component 1
VPIDLAARELPTWVDPAELFLSGPARAAHCFWLDAGPDAASGWSWLGTGIPSATAPRERLCATGDGRGAPRGGHPVEGGPFRGGWIGWLGYDDAAAAAGAPADVDGSAPQELGLAVDRFVAVDHGSGRLWALAPAAELEAFAAEVATWRGASTEPPAAARVHVRSRHTPEGYASLIERCRDAIREGDAYQLCLTTRFETAASVDPVGAYLRLRRATPTHHGGLIRIGSHALVSASPERFLEISAGVVRTRPIKGTRPRRPEAQRDEESAAELRASVKERAENVMIVDLMRNDLQRICRAGTVATERLLDIESYPAVHQLVSTVAGRLSPGVSVGDVLAATFPAGSMTGAPKLSAMSILHELEGAPRGVFSGCFGWVGADGAADLAMVIRSIVTHPGGAYVGAGGGITWRSDPRAEVAEVGVKARGPLAALGGELPPGWGEDRSGNLE